MPLEPWPNEQEMVADLYGGAWADIDSWLRRCRPDGCVICTAGRPYGIIGELAGTWVTTDIEVAVYGYVCVISKVHAVEPYQLSEAEQLQFWRDSMAVAAELAALFGPVKMNYEIHGNTLPHLHMHLFPRRPDDPFVGRSIDLREVHHRYTEADLARLRAAVGRCAQDPRDVTRLPP
jgi:diadenosine tetraphosphate (Ap4A) HIT family hydrolase